MQIILLLLITISLPIAWFIVDLAGYVLARRILGILAILGSFGVAALVGTLRTFEANAYFSTATKQLLTESVAQLKTGHTLPVTRAWMRANEQFHPTYENRAHYQQIVDEAVSDMKQP